MFARIFIGILFIIRFEELINFKLIAGIMLLLSGLIRIGKSFNKMNDTLKKNTIKFHIFNGIIHGLTNMGGGFLALLSSSIFSDKINIRNNIAFGYLLMGILQYFLLFF